MTMRPLTRLVLIAILVLVGCSGRPGPAVLAPQGTGTVAGARVVKVYSVTTRESLRNAPYAYGSDRAPAPQQAAFDISLPPGHVPGKIEWPKGRGTPDPNRDFVTLDKQDIDRAGLLRAVRGKRVGIFVHGFNTSFQEGLYRAAQMSGDAHIDGIPIFFSWPSEAHIAAYLADRDGADYSRTALTTLFTELTTTRRPDETVPVLAHSMGARLAMEALRQLKIAGRTDVLNRLEIVLAAPDIDMDVFREQIRIVGRMHHPMTILVSSDDRALQISSHLAARRTRVGMVDVHDPEVQKAAAKAGIRIIDISSLPTGDATAHSRYVAMLSSGEFNEGSNPINSLRHAGAFIFNGVGNTFQRVGSVLVD